MAMGCELCYGIYWRGCPNCAPAWETCDRCDGTGKIYQICNDDEEEIRTVSREEYEKYPEYEDMKEGDKWYRYGAEVCPECDGCGEVVEERYRDIY